MTTPFPAIAPARMPREQRKTIAPIDAAVILSPFFWNFRDDMWQTTHHVARALASRVPTLLVEPPAQWNPSSAEFRLHRIAAGLLSPRVEPADRNLSVFRRRGFPLGRIQQLSRLQTGWNAAALAEYVRNMGWRNTLLWHSFPYESEPLMEAIGSDLFVYHCLDNSPRLEERRIVERSDLVFGVSQTLVDKLRQWNRRAFLLPNGVDLDLFNPQQAACARRPAGLPKRGRIIGFLGYVNYHVDLELLVKLARTFPRDTIVLVGRVPTGHTAPVGRQRAALATLESLANVRILGFKPTAQLPAYLHAFDLCLIPFLRNPFNQQCDPLKFYQYLAMGKPIVSTPVTVAQMHRDICRVAETHEEFIDAVAASLAHPDSASKLHIRRAVAREHSWPALVDKAWQLIEARRRERLSEGSARCQ